MNNQVVLRATGSSAINNQFVNGTYDNMIVKLQVAGKTT
jgi:hypothetical protein